jgi:hypothetical protein
MDDDNEREGLKREFEQATKDVENLGGWEAFKSGQWLLELITQSFRNYYERASEDCFRRSWWRRQRRSSGKHCDRRGRDRRRVGPAAEDPNAAGRSACPSLAWLSTQMIQKID